ncbi:hypothetical protein [Citrobacter phage Tr1]|nr:hypothetical protein [Citrobacter phage Tr1]
MSLSGTETHPNALQDILTTQHTINHFLPDICS